MVTSWLFHVVSQCFSPEVIFHRPEEIGLRTTQLPVGPETLRVGPPEHRVLSLEAIFANVLAVLCDRDPCIPCMLGELFLKPKCSVELT